MSDLLISKLHFQIVLLLLQQPQTRRLVLNLVFPFYQTLSYPLNHNLQRTIINYLPRIIHKQHIRRPSCCYYQRLAPPWQALIPCHQNGQRNRIHKDPSDYPPAGMPAAGRICAALGWLRLITCICWGRLCFCLSLSCLTAFFKIVSCPVSIFKNIL